MGIGVQDTKEKEVLKKP